MGDEVVSVWGIVYRQMHATQHVHEIIPKEAISGLSEFHFCGMGAGVAGPIDFSFAGILYFGRISWNSWVWGSCVDGGSLTAVTCQWHSAVRA